MSPAARPSSHDHDAAARPASTGLLRFALSWLAMVLALAAQTERPLVAGEGLRDPDPAAGVAPANDPAFATALEEYGRRAAGLRQKALTSGAVNYREVLDAAYPAGGIDCAMLQAKAAWRASAGPAFTFITDYSTVLAAAVVEPLVAVDDPGLKSTLVARYESLSNRIGIAPVATDFAIFHETGHALQRAALQARGVAASQRTGAPEPVLRSTAGIRAADATAVRRLHYLCSQVEFEIRLQDLNRFHAVLTGGRPILDALDSLRALAALGLPLSYEETRDAFSQGGLVLAPETFQEHTSGMQVDTRTIAVAFEDARELGLIRRLALRVDPSWWPALLGKMIFEAPGHL